MPNRISPLAHRVPALCAVPPTWSGACASAILELAGGQALGVGHPEETAVVTHLQVLATGRGHADGEGDPAAAYLRILVPHAHGRDGGGGQVGRTA